MVDRRSPHASGQRPKAARPKGPRPVADLVGGAMRALGVPSARVTEKLRGAWRQASDEAWRETTHLRRLEGGVLDVGVASEALRAELTNFHRDRLLAVLRTALPDVPLIGLRFVTDPADGEGV